MRGTKGTRRAPRHSELRRAVPAHLPCDLAARTARSRRLTAPRHALPAPLVRPEVRAERVRWVTASLTATVLAVSGLLAIDLAPLGLTPGPTRAAADGFDPNYRATQDLGAPGAGLESPAAYSRVGVPSSSRDRAQAAALAANRQARRADVLVTDAADRVAADQIGRRTLRDSALSNTSKAAQDQAARLLARKLEAEQRAKLAAIRAEERAKAGLEPEDSGTTTTDAPLAAGSSTTRRPTTGPVVTGTGGPSASPITNGVIGARFGQVGLWATYHTGIDYRAGYGTPIHAAADGVVVVAGNIGDWSGNHVAIKHADGTTTMYSHMSAIDARLNESVGAGQVIGYVGSSGRAFGAHLHFEVYPAGVAPGDVYRAVNPLPWLAGRGVRAR